jgi:hypothetical protein
MNETPDNFFALSFPENALRTTAFKKSPLKTDGDFLCLLILKTG